MPEQFFPAAPARDEVPRALHEVARHWTCVASLLSLVALGACAAPRASSTEPYVVVLGTAQDGGLPQIGCRDELCERARHDASARRFVTSLVLADPRSGKRWLFDATPDLRGQFELARSHPPTHLDSAGRAPLFDGVFLTHAHVGHYAGLEQLGREIYASNAQPVWGSTRMLAFLRDNGPWSLLVETRAIELHELELDASIELGPGLSVSALRVPHRDEFSDTLAFVIRGPRRSLAYLPDIDKWERWDVKLEDFLARVDVALIDGTFFAEGEIPGRAMADIPHPFISETIARLHDAPAELRARVVFTHLNHTNPASDSESSANAAIEAAGMRVAREREVIEL